MCFVGNTKPSFSKDSQKTILEAWSRLIQDDTSPAAQVLKTKDPQTFNKEAIEVMRNWWYQSNGTGPESTIGIMKSFHANLSQIRAQHVPEAPARHTSTSMTGEAQQPPAGF